MAFYELRKKDTHSDDGYVSIVVEAQNIILAMIAVNQHLELRGREDLQSSLPLDYRKIVPSDNGILYSNVQRIPKHDREDEREESENQPEAQSNRDQTEN